MDLATELGIHDRDAELARLQEACRAARDYIQQIEPTIWHQPGDGLGVLVKLDAALGIKKDN